MSWISSSLNLFGIAHRLQITVSLHPYGMHEADSAMMTCLLFSLDQSKHVHFIDEFNSGFAIAARQLKQQVKDIAAAKP